jgi:hypothetical protein
VHCQWPVLLPFRVVAPVCPRLLPLCVDCGLLVVLHVELSLPGPHPDVGGAADGLGVDVLHVELSVPGPHPASAVGGGGGVPPVLLFGFVGINGGTLITPPVAFPAGFTEPGGTLIMLPGGSVPVLAGAFGPNGAITPVVLTEP